MSSFGWESKFAKLTHFFEGNSSVLCGGGAGDDVQLLSISTTLMTTAQHLDDVVLPVASCAARQRIENDFAGRAAASCDNSLW